MDQSHSRARRPRLERLESRRLLVAEGTPFEISQVVDLTGLTEDVSATVRGGDGTAFNAPVTGIGQAGDLRIRFDFRYDTTNFFTQSRRDLLQIAGDALVRYLGDDLTAIVPSGINTWNANFLNPASGNQVSVPGLNVAANELVVFAAARNLPGNQLGQGGTGGWSATGSTAWLENVRSRGESNTAGAAATDFGPWGGSVAFDLDANWYFGTEAPAQGSNQNDFLSVATHELAHVLGFGTSRSFARLVNGESFTGAKARAADPAPGNVALNGGSHFASDILSGGQQPLMSANIAIGTRKILTPLDLAALDDLGWEVINNMGVVSTSHVYADNGSYPVEVVIRGSRVGERVIGAGTANVTNVTPAITLIDDQATLVGQEVVLTDLVRIEDPGFATTSTSPSTQETFTYAINWGDGSPLQTGAATLDRVGSSSQTTLASVDGRHTYSSTGNFQVSVSVTDDDGGTRTGTFRVNVTVPPALSLDLSRSSVVENEGNSASALTVRRPSTGNLSAAVIDLVSSDLSEIWIPSSVAFLNGQYEVSVPVRAVDDSLLDGTQSVRLSASADSFTPASVDIAVTDFEFLTADLADSVVEGNAAGASLTLTRSNSDAGQPLAITVAGGDPSQLRMPSTITIPAGQQTLQLVIATVDDDDPELSEDLQFTFEAAGYIGATGSLRVLDDEPPKFQNPNDVHDVDGADGTTVLDALLVINELFRREGDVDLNPDVDPFRGRYYDVSGDYKITALDALLVINSLNRLPNATASGESVVAPLRRSREIPDRELVESALPLF
ncbi:MAG: dockerin type I domain-containing protein [Planctomycetota bacterium]